jgi:pimeloyl-ACP methyl ester carboxylesterase
LGPDHIARAWAELMKRLGYTRYVAQGGDWGAPISSAMARQAPAGLLGIHINLPATVPPEVAAVLAGGGPERLLTKDEMLDDITLYWLTNSATSSARLYWENSGRGIVVAAAQKTAEISLPVAITVFPEEIYRAPDTWARRAYRNLIYFHEVDKGGHFAAWEEPELFAEEIRAAFRSLR